jgi:hypothetical protein
MKLKNSTERRSITAALASITTTIAPATRRALEVRVLRAQRPATVGALGENCEPICAIEYRSGLFAV